MCGMTRVAKADAAVDVNADVGKMLTTRISPPTPTTMATV